MHQLFIGDLLVFILLSYSLDCIHLEIEKDGRFFTTGNESNTSELVELLQKFAVEKFTSSRLLETDQFGSLAIIVTTDYEALYAYKHGDYQRCLQLSTENVHTLLNAIRMACVVVHEVFIQLLDDDIVSLTALRLIVNPNCGQYTVYRKIMQVTLSLYLMTQCQLKLRHSVTSLAETLHYIKLAQRRTPVNNTLDQLILRLACCKIVTELTRY